MRSWWLVCTLPVPELVLGSLLLSAAIVTEAEAQSFLDELPNASTTAELVAVYEKFDIKPGDIDSNGTTEFADFLVLSNEWGRKGADLTYQNGDLNLDGTVNLTDFALLSFNFGRFSFQPDSSGSLPNGNLGLWRDENGMLSLSSANPVAVGAFEITSPSGGLEPVDVGLGVPEPFLFFLGFNKSSVAVATLGNSPVIDGDYATSINSSADDLEIRWIESGSYDVYSLPFGAGDPLTGRATSPQPERVPTRPPRPQPPAPIDPFAKLDAATNLESLLVVLEEQDIPRGELNLREPVTFADVRVLRENWGGDDSIYSKGDLNLDGDVGLDDFAILVPNLGKSGWSPVEERIVEDPAALAVSVNEFGQLQLSTDRPIELGGLELLFPKEGGIVWQSLGAIGLGHADDSFDELLHVDQHTVAYGNFEGDVRVDDAVFFTDLQLVANKDHEVVLRWFERGSLSVVESGPFMLSYEIDSSFGDIDGSGDVSFTDFLAVSSSFGQSVEPSTLADITGDGLVDFHDFLIVSFNFGRSAPREVQPVPEPAFDLQLVLVTLSTLALCRSHRREQSRVRSHLS